MKSIIVLNEVPKSEQKNYTDIQVLESHAGFYLGTMYEERDASGNLTWQEPGSRDSGYFATRIAAESALSDVNAGETGWLRDSL